MVNIRKILVPVDFSKNTEAVVDHGLHMARLEGAGLIFLHLISLRLTDALHGMSNKGYKGEILEGLRRFMKDKEEELRLLLPTPLPESMEILIRKGEAAEELASIAKDLSVDLIIVGSRGEESTSATGIGSVAKHVLNDAPCPVLLVRPVVHDFIR